MFETRSFAVDIETKLNNIAQELSLTPKFKVTDNFQDYETHIMMLNNNEGYHYTPAILEVLSPIVPSARVGVYVSTYKLTLYGYSDEIAEVEQICNSFASLYSETTINIDDSLIGLSIGGLSIPRALIGSLDGFAHLGNRFEGNILINIQIPLNANFNLGSEIKLFVDNEECEYFTLKYANEKSLLNTKYEAKEDCKLVAESLQISFPFLKCNYAHYKSVDDQFVRDDDGIYLKTQHDGREIFYLESAQRYSVVEGEYVEDINGKYILTTIDGELIYIIPNPERIKDINGSTKINELFQQGISHTYNSRHLIRLKFPQYDKEGYYNLRTVSFVYNKNNEPLAFVVVFDMSFDRHTIKIDGSDLNILSFNFANVGTSETITSTITNNDEKVGLTRNILTSSGKGFSIIFEHDNSEKSTQLVNEGINELFGSLHTLTISIDGCPSNPSLKEITRTYNVFMSNFKFANAENPAMMFEVVFSELEGD